MTIILQRLVEGSNCVFGTIIKDSRPILTTLELPWKNNQKSVSCIPVGTYKCSKMYSTRFRKRLFEVLDVLDREHIEIHSGNTAADTEGCILLGMSYSLSDDAIISSKLALDNFMAMMPDEFTMIVKDVVVKEGETSWV